MKIQAKETPFINSLLDEWHNKVVHGEQIYFHQFLKKQYDIEITQGNAYLWSHEYFIFESELDYFMVLMRLS